MSTAPKTRRAKAAGKQNTSEQATEEKTRALPVAADADGFSPGDWESNTPTELRPSVVAARENFLFYADQVCHRRLWVAIRAFKPNRFGAPAASVLKPCVEGWIERLVGEDLLVGVRGVAINHFASMLAIAQQNPEIIVKPVPWAESQTRSALNQFLGTMWFSTPKPEIKAESRKVTLWLREMEEAVFGLPRPVPDPALKGANAIAEEWHTWRAHGWLTGWLPPSTPAARDFVARPLDLLPQEVQDYIVEDITSCLFQVVEDRLKRAVDKALEAHARSNPANVSQNMDPVGTLVARAMRVEQIIREIRAIAPLIELEDEDYDKKIRNDERFNTTVTVSVCNRDADLREKLCAVKHTKKAPITVLAAQIAARAGDTGKRLSPATFQDAHKRHVAEARKLLDQRQ